MAVSNLPKNLDDHLPILKDQGIRNVVGTYKRGVSMQHISTVMPTGGVIKFADFGLSNMAGVGYAVIVVNHTTASKIGKVTRANRLTSQITITGPDDNDELDIVIIGQIYGQLDS